MKTAPDNGLKQLTDVKKQMNPTICYGLIGKKLGHSFSARYFNDKFSRENIPAHYSLFEIEDADAMMRLIEEHPDLRGLNVTIPYKQEVIPMLDSLSPTAEGVGAVNTIRIERSMPAAESDQAENLRLIGHNTDAFGFREAIRPLLKGRRRALVLGLGGASKAVIYALNELGIDVTKVSRTAAPGVLTYADLSDEIMDSHDIIVNCTPLGMWPETDACPDIPYSKLSNRYLCFDLIYNPEYTQFMRRSAEQGAEVCNGLQMLHNQADAAYEFWNTRTFSVPNIISKNSGKVSVDYEKDKANLHLCRVMSRKITVIDCDGQSHEYYLSIAEVLTTDTGSVESVSVRPFTREICNVRYFDNPISIRLMNKLTL